MILESKIVKGRTSITSLGDTFIKNLKIISSSRSFPANSAIYSHTDCKRNINIKIKKVLANVLM